MYTEAEQRSITNEVSNEISYNGQNALETNFY